MSRSKEYAEAEIERAMDELRHTFDEISVTLPCDILLGVKLQFQIQSPAEVQALVCISKASTPAHTCMILT